MDYAYSWELKEYLVECGNCIAEKRPLKARSDSMGRSRSLKREASLSSERKLDLRTLF